MKNQDLFHQSTVMAIGTVLSRIAGFIRSVLTVAVLGTALLADSFNVANTMPNIIYNLMVGGALTAIFVPQLVKSKADKDGGLDFASRLVTTISLILGLLVIVGVIFAPALVRIYAPEFSQPGFENIYELTLTMMRICLPQIFFLGLFTMLGQVANSRGSFAPMMWAPIANNLVGIALLTYFILMVPKFTADTITDTQVAILGWGTTAGVVVQALLVIPAVKKTNFHLKIRFGLSGLGKSFSLAGWTLVYVLISQLGYLVTVSVATSAAVRSAKAGITTGVGITPFQNSYYVMMLPYGIVTISLITALLPHISELAIKKDRDGVKNELVRAIRMVGVITVPAGMAFFLLGPLMTSTIFVGIPYEDGLYMGYVLSALGVGLVTFSINLILLRGFNAFEDTRTQVPSIILINVISVALSYLFLNILDPKWVTVGLGAAFSISYVLGLPYTLHLLKRHTGELHIREFLGQHLKLILASFVAMFPLYLIANYWHGINQYSPLAIRALELLIFIVLGAIGYFVVAQRMKVAEIAVIMEYLPGLKGLSKGKKDKK
jgi:putative peptidoglycan lipid II flippase